MHGFLKSLRILSIVGATVLVLIVGGREAACAGKMPVLGCKLTEAELAEYRGGYSGFYFGLRFTGYWDNLGNASGSLVSDGNMTPMTGAELPPPGDSSAQLSTTGATVQAYVGDFHGASGIFQVVQSPGSYNVIQNNLALQITMINVANDAAMRQLSEMLPW